MHAVKFGSFLSPIYCVLSSVPSLCLSLALNLNISFAQPTSPYYCVLFFLLLTFCSLLNQTRPLTEGSLFSPLSPSTKYLKVPCWIALYNTGMFYTDTCWPMIVSPLQESPSKLLNCMITDREHNTNFLITDFITGSFLNYKANMFLIW